MNVMKITSSLKEVETDIVATSESGSMQPMLVPHRSATRKGALSAFKRQVPCRVQLLQYMSRFAVSIREN